MKRVCSALLLLPLAVSAVSASGGRDERASSLPAFGATVAIVGDQAFVGEPRGAKAGTVHIYRRGPAGWKETGTLTAPAGAPNDGFGTTLVSDGTTLLVSRIDGPTATDSAKGAVHVFRKNAAGVWTAAGVLQAGTRVARGDFGRSMTILGDVVAIGSPRDGAGAVYLYRRGTDGSYTAAGTLAGAELGDAFGSSLASDGQRIAVGAPSRSMRKGAVLVFGRQTDGSFKSEGVLLASRGADNAQFGVSIAIKGDMIAVGSPGALPITGQGNGTVGMVVAYQWNPKTSAWRETDAAVPFSYAGAGFGTSVAFAGNELLIGAPAAVRNTGHLYRAALGKDGKFTSVARVEVAGIDPGARLADVVAVSGEGAAIGMPRDGGGEGTVLFLGRSVAGTWSVKNTIIPAPAETWTAMTGAEVVCKDGKVKDWECGNTGLMSYLPISAIGGKRGVGLSGNWGWTDPETGKDYALVGRTDGTSFVDVTDPARPRYLGNLPKTPEAQATSWREIKTLKHYALIVSDASGPHGVQIFDMHRLRGVKTPQEFTPDVTYDKVASVHDILTNEESMFAYAVGSNGPGENCGGGYHMIDMRDPLKPTFAGCHADKRTGRSGTGYSHDALCQVYRGPDTRYQGKEICLGSNETAISIADFSDKQNVKILGLATYPDVGYTHQGWWSEDMRYFYLNDELDETGGKGDAAKATRTLIFDFAKLDDPVFVGPFLGTSKASDHNLYVKGNRMYQSNYKAGLRIIDITNPTQPREVGFFDVEPGENSPGFSGTWNSYPYFKNGSILVNNMGKGIFLVRDRTSTVP